MWHLMLRLGGRLEGIVGRLGILGLRLVEQSRLGLDVDVGWNGRVGGHVELYCACDSEREMAAARPPRRRLVMRRRDAT